MGWTKADNADRPIFHRTTPDGAGGILIRNASGLFEVFANNNTGYVVFAAIPAPTDTWMHFAFLRENGVGKIYINGKLEFAAPLTKNLDFPDAILQVGRRADNAARAKELALLRVGATAPNAAQMAKIYRDEWPMFQPNAQVSLHGTYKNVNALTRDKDTGLLHVATPVSRSIFAGLVRIESKTASLGSKIAAHDGMILED